jgi:hypothetical protein
MMFKKGHRNTEAGGRGGGRKGHEEEKIKTEKKHRTNSMEKNAC